jgi:hypothetical protein
MSKDVAADAVTRVANVTTYAGMTGSVVGGLALSEVIAIGGFLVALLGVAVNFWHKRAIVRIARERWELERMAIIQSNDASHEERG